MPFYKLMDFWLFVPLGRLAFCVYLVQLTPMAFDLSMSYERVSIAWYPMVISPVACEMVIKKHLTSFQCIRFFALMVICWPFGYMLFLFVEGPMISISKAHVSGELQRTSTSDDAVAEQKSNGHDVNNNSKRKLKTT